MTQHATDFSEYPTGQPPSDWTAWAEAAMSELTINENTGEKYLTILSAAATGRRFYTWDAVAATSTVEIYYEFEDVDSVLGRDARAVMLLNPAKNGLGHR